MSKDQPKQKSLPNLPESKDEFWEEAEKATLQREEVTPSSKHFLIWKGPYAYCTSCPYGHTVPLDMDKFDLVDGVPVKKLTDNK